MSNREVEILREVVVKITKLLTNQSIQVTQCGAQAFAKADRTGKPVLINIPFIPDNASAGFLAAVQGFIDHEVGHVLFTDFSVPNRIRNSLLHSCWNQFEDPFVERKMTEKFPGTAHNLDRVGEYFIKHLTEPALAKCKTEDEVYNVVSICVIRAKSGQVVFDRWCQAKGIYDLPKVKGLLDAIGPADVAKMPKIASTAESLRYARKMFDYLVPPKPLAEEEPEEEQAPPPPPAPPAPPTAGDPEPSDKDEEPGEGEPAAAPPSEAEKGDSGSETTESSDDAGPEQGDGDTDSEAEPEASSGDVEHETALDHEEPEKADAPADTDEGDPEADAGDDEQAGGDEGEQPGSEDDGEVGAAGAPDDEDGPEPEEGDEEAAGGAGAGEDSGMGDSDEAADQAENEEVGGGIGSVDDVPEAQDGDQDRKVVRDFMSQLTEHLTDESTLAAAKEPYLVYSRDRDVIEVYEVDATSYKDEWLVKMDDEAGKMVGVMQKDIERMMASRSRVMQVPGFRSGRLHASSLHRLRTGDDRVFGRRHEAKGKQTVVSLLIDNSGSMHGQKMTTAMTSAYAMSLTLERVGIKHEVLGFTTGTFNIYSTDKSDQEYLNAMQEEATRIGRNFSRMDILDMPIFKRFTERLTPAVKKRFADAATRQQRMRSNVDGECVEIAAKRLRAEKADRHVLIVFSDGNPAGQGDAAGFNQHLKAVVKATIASKVDVFGVGIQDTSVKRFYPHNVVINTPAELPKVVMGHIKNVLGAA